MPVRDLLFAASTQGAAPSDADFEYVTLLLNGDGTNGAQNNTFLDSSTNNFTITRNGNTTQGSFSPYGSLWSNYFDGSGDYLSLTGATAIGTSNYTVEYWIFPTSTEVLQGVFVTSLSAVTGNLRTGIYNGKVYVDIYDGTGSVDSGSSVPLNTWSHIAITKSGSSYTSYLNGAVNTTWTDSTTITGTTWTIARLQSDGYDYQGYVSNLRVVVGSVVYTSAFTPSTTPLTAVTNTKLLTCQSNRFIDNSTSAFALTRTGTPSVQRFSPFNPTAPYSTSVIGGSGYFDGSGDWLATSSSSNQWAFGTGDFTVECWLYTGAATNRVIMANRAGSTGLSTHWSLEFFNTAQRVEWHTGLAIVASSNTNAQLNAWVHIAVVRNSGTMKIYQNGVEVASATDLNVYTDVNPLLIANEPVFPSGNNPFLGYISNIRIVKGTAVYTSAFTPPTAPVTAITNTSFLGNMTNAGIPDLAMQNNLETVGNAQVSTSVKKYGTGSISFDGTGDGLNAPDSPQFDMGSGNFTVEMWVYANSLSGEQFLVGQHNNSTYYAPFRFAFTGAQLVAFMSTTGSSWGLRLEAGSSLSTSTWYHIALVRNGTSFKIYVNGTQYDSGTLSNALYNSTDIMRVGWGSIGAGEFSLNGYIDDLRITKGVARYTANFTPPTAALPTF